MIKIFRDILFFLILAFPFEIIHCQNANFSSNLPILNISTVNGSEIPNEPKVTAHLGIIYNGPGQTNHTSDPFNEYDGFIGIEIRGTSSLLYEKKGYGFETRNEDGSNNNVELIGLPKENDWVLHGPFSDKTLLRNVLSYHLGELTGRYAPRTRLCEVFVNNDYRGVFVLTEKIKQDKNRVDIAKLTEEDNAGDGLTGGYIIKVDRNDENIPGLGWDSSFPDFKFIAYVEPKAGDITNAQKNYIQNYLFQFELAMSQSDYQETYLDYIDLKSWVDYLLVTEITKHIDAYKLSLYMYKDKDSNGGKLHMGPLWDFNLGYGNFDFACSSDPSGWAYEFPLCGSWHPFWTRKINDIDNVQHFTNCRWEELRNGPFRTDSIINFIDEKVDFMGEAIDRNFERWPILGEDIWPNDYVGATYAEELDFFKRWIVFRLDWMDSNMIGNCEAYVTSIQENPQFEMDIYPNPATTLVNIKLEDLGNRSITYQILNLDGQIVSEIQTLINNYQIPIDHLEDGVYILKIQNGNGLQAQKMFIKYSFD